MRLWTLHPKHLDAVGLVSVWRKALLAREVLRGRTTVVSQAYLTGADHQIAGADRLREVESLIGRLGGGWIDCFDGHGLRSG